MSRHNPLLWASLLPTPADSSEKHIPAIPIVPENKINTSLRVVLHDTKATLEQFSDRLGILVTGVEQAKRDIDKVGKDLDQGHDKVLDELNAVVNRSQKGLLEVLGTPAQAQAIDVIKSAQVNADRKLDALENRTDLIHRQLQALSEQQGHLLTQQGHILTQQGHILTSLATITPLTPLLKDSPQQQTQILTTLTALTPLLPLIQSLPAQVKASQQETLQSFTASIGIDHSSLHTSPHLLLPSVKRISRSTSSDPVDHTLKRKHSENSRPREEQHQSLQDVSASNSPDQQTVSMSSSKTLNSGTSLPAPALSVAARSFTRQIGRPDPVSSNSNSFFSLPTSSDPHAVSSSLAKSAAVSTSEDTPKGRKRQKLKENVDDDAPQKDMYARDTGRLILPSSRTLRSDTSEAQSAARRVTRSKSSRFPALPASASSSSLAPAATRPDPASTSTAPTPHAPGSFLQPRSTVPGRLLAATSYSLGSTPTPAPRSSTRRPTIGGRTLIPPSHPIALRDIAYDLSPSSGAQVLVAVPPGSGANSAGPSGNPLGDLDAYASSDLSAHRPPVRRKILADKDDIDLDWGDIAPG